jgi:hypothetical protein
VAIAPRPSLPTFTAPIRGHAGIYGPRRWEVVLSNEASTSYRLTAAAARLGPLGRALGAPRRAGGRDPSLAAREARWVEVQSSPLYHRLERVRGRIRHVLGRDAAPPGPAGPIEPDAPPPSDPVAAAVAPSRLGPYTSRRVDEALELLKVLPFEELQRRGWHFQPNHFYWPLNDVAFLAANRELWHDRGLPREIDWDLDGQGALMERIATYAPELADLPEEPLDDASSFTFGNTTFGSLDAFAYYGIVRTLEPARVVEVGSGWSSMLLARALERNGHPCEVTLVEPFPDEEVFAGLPAEWTVQRELLQHADLALFERLGEGDVCFYDGSHCARAASDVNWFLFEVMPRLARGTWVHFHDIFLPDDYHDVWIFEEGLSWNEQYVLQAFLMHNDAWKVRFASHMLSRTAREKVDATFAPGAVGGSVWLERVA